MGVIMHNNIPYGGGSSIEPNPQESATEQLETLGIDGDVYEVTDANAIHTSDVGVANGVAELDANGFVPSSQLPSYVDDVLEYASRSAFPATGETGKIYVALDTNLTYRWGGSDYVEISPSLALGETSSTAYRGDRGKIAYDHSQSDHSGIKPAFTEAATRANIASGETIATIFGKIKKWFSDLKTVAFSGSYNDLSNKPTIPAAQVNSDWNANSGVAEILNKPALATVATSGSYNDLSNKPTIPTVNDGTLTIQKNGTQVATFSANQSGNATANIECATPSDVEGSKTATGNPLTITDAAPIKAEQLVFEIEPIQAGSGTPSPSNIRAITGLSEVSGGTCGKNLFNRNDVVTNKVPDVTNNGRLMTQNGTDTTEHFIPLKPSTTYTISGNSRIRFWLYDANGDYLDTYLQDAGQFTTNAQTYFIRVSGNSGWQNNNIQIEKNPSATTYEAFKGDNVTIQLGQTVYGGTLTLNADGSAECYCNRGLINCGSLTYRYDTSATHPFFVANVSSEIKLGASGISSAYINSAVTLANDTNGAFAFLPNLPHQVRIRDNAHTDPTEFKTYLTNNNITIVAELATPFTIHLTAEQLQLLENLNNISTNAKTLTVKYQPNNAIGQAKGTAQELVDSASTWKLFAESANANIALPTNCKELYICVIYVTGSTSAIMYDFHILPDILTKATSYFRQGDYYTPDYFSRCEIRIRKTSNVYDTRVEHLYMNNTTDRAENTTVKVYYR